MVTNEARENDWWVRASHLYYFKEQYEFYCNS